MVLLKHFENTICNCLTIFRIKKEKTTGVHIKERLISVNTFINI